MNRVWIISDTHIGHANIIKYSPTRLAWCSTIEEHDAAIIDAWKRVVADSDTVIHCGDFALGPVERAKSVFAQLPGQKRLISGNHDRSPPVMRSIGFLSVHNRLRISHCGLEIVFRHRPQDFVEPVDHADVLIHGHIHGVPMSTPRDSRHEYPESLAMRAKLIDASIEALPTTPAPIELTALLRHHGKLR